MNRCASLRLLGGGGPAGSDRPDGLVGDHEVVVLAGGEGDRLDLDLQHELHVARLALLERLADARDHAEARLECRTRAARDHLVRLAEQLPALGVADKRSLTPSSRSIPGETSPV